MPSLLVNKETAIAMKAVREINRRANGEMVEIARRKARELTGISVPEALAGAFRLAYAPVVALAPPPTVAMLNRFMARVDWNHVAEQLLVNPELN